METLLRMFLLPQDLKTQNGDEDDVQILDPEDISYQASFSKLGASETARADPFANVGEPRDLLRNQLVEASRARPGVVRLVFSTCSPSLTVARKYGPLLAAVPAEFAGPFQAYLSQTGSTIA
jgi:exportin-2 (importin alpha re-exporter)